MLQVNTLIAGSGIMGLACAFSEARRGKTVCVFDRFEFSQKASWASAGILTNRDAKIFHSPFREFQVKSQQLYPSWLGEISRVSGETIELQKEGAYHLFDTTKPEGQQALHEELEKLKREGAQNYQMSTSAPTWLTGWLTKEELTTLYFPEEAYVSNRNLLHLLYKACRNLGVQFIENAQIKNLHSQATHISLELLSQENRVSLHAQNFIVCAGVWSNDVLKYLGLEGKFIPVKGQAFTIKNFLTQKSFIHYGKELYLVPRGDQLLVGVTTEPRIMDEDFTEFGEQAIRNFLKEGFPSLANQPILESWAGIRPRTPDRLPLLGAVNPAGNVLICSGHYKSGIGMAPLSADWISAYLAGEELPIHVPEFDPLRKKGLRSL